MTSAKRVGRIIGILLLVQGVSGFVMNFVLLRPAMKGFLANAAGSAAQVRGAVLIAMLTGALSIGITILAFPVFRRCSQALALWFVALGVAGFALLVVENVAVLSMLSLSQQYAEAAVADAGMFAVLGRMVAAARNGLHYANLLVGGGMILVLYATLYRSALVPRALAAVGVVAVLLQLTAVTMPLLGRPMVLPMLAPLGLTHLALACWLLVRGFDEHERLAPVGPRGVALAGA